MEIQPGRASGIGSWPGTDAFAAIRATFDSLGDPHIPYLPELPSRGPGAHLIGRGAVFLVDLPVDLQPSGWRLVDHPGRDLARAQSWLRQDLDALAEVADGWRGPLKVQVTGPWTLAASLHLVRLERAVADPGACRDLVASLAEGVRQHVADVRRLVPGADVIVQLDEPSLPAVLQGGIPTASGFGRLRAIQEQTVVEGLTAVVDAAIGAGAGAVVLHSCANDVPIAALARTGVSALSLDLARVSAAQWEELAVLIEGTVALWAGLVPTSGPIGTAATLADALWLPWRRLGLDAATAANVVITPSCGLANGSLPRARTALTRARETANELAERSASV